MLKNGFIAGFIATAVLSAVMFMKGMMGIMPELDPVGMLTNMAHGMMGAPATPIVGWIMHFAIGSIVWGGSYALLYKSIPGNSAVSKAVVFAIFAWLLMMVGPMVVAGKGLFGLTMGIMAPIMTFMLHIVFGVVMGNVYKKLSTR